MDNVYINHIKKIWFQDLNKEILWWIFLHLILKCKEKNFNTSFKEEFIEMTFNLGVKAKANGYYWMYEKVVAKYPKLLSLFYELFLVKFGFSLVHYLQSKQRVNLNIEQGDLQLKLTNLQMNIYYLLSNHQIHPTH